MPKTKTKKRPAKKAAAKKTTPAPTRRSPPVRGAFLKKAQKPTADEFTARLPLAVGKRFESLRSFLTKQKDVTEEVFFYGPKSGWALRYLQSGAPICTLMLHGDRPVGLVALDAETNQRVPWKDLSALGQEAKQRAHGSPTMLWLHVPLDGKGATDFKTLLKAKLGRLPPMC